MTKGGYGFHPIWRNLVTTIKELDVEAVRRQAGLAAPNHPDGTSPRTAPAS